MLEAHLTLDVAESDEARVRAWAEARGLRITCIHLARGRHARQVMLTLRDQASLADALRRARVIADEARDACGASMRRTKVEAPLDVPAHGSGRTLYLEHHVRVLVATDRLVALERLAVDAKAHLSRNAFKETGSGAHERFLTSRFDADATPLAARALETLLEHLGREGFRVTKVEAERVLYDDAHFLDDGWLEEEVRPS